MVWIVAAYGVLTALVVWPGLRVVGHLVLSLYSSDEPSELLQWLSMMTIQ